MEDDDGEETPRSPFWIQSTTNIRRVERYRLRISSFFFNSLVLIIVLLVLAVLSMVFIVPSAIDFSSHIFRPNLVKRSWDSINFVLVLVALAFGFLSRNVNNDGYDRSPSGLSAGAPVMSPSSSTPRQWYDFPDQPIGSTVGLRRQKTSSSYPDLRELSPPWNHADPWRFSDDTHLNYYRGLDSNRSYLRHRSRREQDYEIKDAFVGFPQETLYSSPAQPPSLPPQPPANTMKRKTKRMYHNVAVDDGERSSSSSGPKKTLSPMVDPVPEPSSPLLVRQAFEDVDGKSVRTERKRNSGNATKEFFTSFYHKKKKKRQRQKSVDNLDSLLHHSQTPPVTFQVPPAPPPPPPRPTTTRVAPLITDKPPVPLKLNSFTIIDESSSGGESPMKQIPPPPPLPPFKMPDWKFAVEGDFVRLQSTLSSRSVSPDGDEARSPSSDVDGAVAAGAASPVFCPSPDVDPKADNFIARFRAGLKLEKNNSLKQNQGFRMSKLGPGPSDL